MREAREETGFLVQLTGLYPVQTFLGVTGHPIAFFRFACDIIGGELTIPGDEIRNVRWSTPAESAALPDSAVRNPAAFRRAMQDTLAGTLFPLDVLAENLPGD